MELIFGFGFVVFAVVFLAMAIRIVPQQQAIVVERVGRYHATLQAGLHFMVPFVDVVRYRHSLKEVVIDVPEQICITKDNVQVNVDGILFYRVMDAQKASYGVANFGLALIQLAQTTLRSEIGKLDLDRTFESREHINGAVIAAIDRASEPWGVKVLRYEIKAINPPRDVVAAMEKQMRADREKRAVILESEGERDAKINRAEGIKQETIKNSEAQKQRSINEAEGQASAILAVASATADGLDRVAKSLGGAGGRDAAQLKVAEEYLKQFGALAKSTNTMIVPANVSDAASLMGMAYSLFGKKDPKSTREA